MKTKHKIAVLWAMLAAALYAFSSPISKILLKEIPPTMMAAFLYLGAGIGMSIIGFIRHTSSKSKRELHLTKNELPYTIGMVVLDIAAPIFLMIGLKMTTSANASLLNNFEIVVTSLIALFIFKEAISKRLWLAIVLITLSSIILSIHDINSISFSFGSIFVLLACICWGFENNCTRMFSALQIQIMRNYVHRQKLYLRD